MGASFELCALVDEPGVDDHWTTVDVLPARADGDNLAVAGILDLSDGLVVAKLDAGEC
ncbi:MAG: hypothetical protein ABSG43_18200 [Solirubrobacteraceae bacterium]